MGSRLTSLGSCTVNPYLLVFIWLFWSLQFHQAGNIFKFNVNSLPTWCCFVPQEECPVLLICFGSDSIKYSDLGACYSGREGCIFKQVLVFVLIRKTVWKGAGDVCAIAECDLSLDRLQFLAKHIKVANERSQKFPRCGFKIYQEIPVPSPKAWTWFCISNRHPSWQSRRGSVDRKIPKSNLQTLEETWRL